MTHEQYMVAVLHRGNKVTGQYINAVMYYPNHKPGKKYVKTLEEAHKVLEYAYGKFNGAKAYNAEGERTETTKAGAIGVSMTVTKHEDRSMEIVSHYIKKRTVTDWEEVEEG